MKNDEIESAALSGTDGAGLADLRLSRLDGQRRPVLLRLMAVLACVCLLIVGLQGWNLWTARQAELDETAVATANMALALSAHAESVLKVGNATLSEMVERVEAGGADGGTDARLHRRLADIVRGAPEIQGLFVYGPRGDWRTTSLPAPVAGNNGDREYFRYHATHTDRATHVGKPVRSRSTGALVIPLSRRIDNPDGSFGGVALVTLNLAFFSKFYESFEVGRSGTIVLETDDGTLIFRRPYIASQAGTSIGNGQVMQLVRSGGPAGTRMLTSPVDGIERLYSYRHLDGFPLIVASALARDEVLESWRQQAWFTSAIVLLAIGLLGWGSSRMLRQIRVRDQLERQLRVASKSLQRHNLALQDLADSDGLTGLANRRLFEASLAREYERARRKDGPFSVILVDVDFFKRYNDRYGHVAGDDCLRRVAAAVGAAPRRPCDLAARYGGEEFAVILPDTDLAGATAVAESIRAAVAALGVEHADSPCGQVTASLGVYTGHPRMSLQRDPLALVEAADQLLYDAKANGRNRVMARAG